MSTSTLPRTSDEAQMNHPYGVNVGDRVYYWPEDPPPLSDVYVAPECQPALILGFSWDEKSVWLADLAVVEPDGHGGASVRLRRGVLQVESSASSYSNPQRSYGTTRGGSWHKDLIHETEQHA